jgi:hypothetical protein
MTKFTQYGLSAIVGLVLLTSYLNWLADRDSKAIQYYNQQNICNSFTFHPDCPQK